MVLPATCGDGIGSVGRWTAWRRATRFGPRDRIGQAPDIPRKVEKESAFANDAQREAEAEALPVETRKPRFKLDLPAGAGA